jgi:hypothetical protein
MFRRKYLPEDMDRSATPSHAAMTLCCAIVEDAEDARQFTLYRRDAIDPHCVVPSAPGAIRHGSALLPSELTSLVA